jgi:hypothetical protein
MSVAVRSEKADVKSTTVAAIVSTAVLVTILSVAPGAQTPTFRTSVELVVVHVNVADASKRPLANL